ncbi:hypothetical protein INR49_007146 [Caranx melampygus]|nr:hypothetical protein INR49_007146 [Caranx melampygus]
MAKALVLRALVEQRLSAAVEEIFVLFERTITEYEEELCRSEQERERQKKLLDAVLTPHRLDCSLPNFTPATPPLQVEVAVVPNTNIRHGFSRLPGLCRRLKRRRVTVLCNLEKYCWRRRGQGRRQKNQSGQVCRCPRGSRGQQSGVLKLSEVN